MQNGFLLPAPTQNLHFHHVAPGDTLSKIINTYYPYDVKRMKQYIEQVLVDNPMVKNPDFIIPGQLLVLRTVPGNMCLAPIESREANKVKELWNLMSPETQHAIKETAPIYNALSLGLAGGGAGLFTLQNTLKSNMGFLNGIPDAYKQYKSGSITKYEFDKIRNLKLEQYAKNVGFVINKTMYGDNKLNAAFKLQPGRSLDPTKSMSQHLNKLKNVSNAASKGGLVLAGVGLAASCYQVAQADTLTEKNEIAVKALTSTGVGVMAGVIVSVILVGTPIGWGVILLAGVATAGVSWASGEFAGDVYKTNFSNVDIVNSIGITKVCN